MRPPDARVAELLRSGNGFGKSYNDTVARVRDAECLALATLVAQYGPNGARMSNEQWAVLARMNVQTVRKHWAHLEADGIVKGKGGGRGRGNRRLRVPRYPVREDASKAPPTWEPAADAGLKPASEAGYEALKPVNQAGLDGVTRPVLGDETAGQSPDSASTHLQVSREVPQESKQEIDHDTCPQIDPWLCACCDSTLNRDQHAAGQGVCSDCWRQGRRAARPGCVLHRCDGGQDEARDKEDPAGELQRQAIDRRTLGLAVDAP